MSRGRRVLLLAAGFVLVVAARFAFERPIPTPTWAEALDQVVAREEGVRVLPLGEDALAVLGVDRAQLVELPRAGWAPVWLYAGYYAGQRRDAQIHAPEYCYPGAGWDVERNRPLSWEGHRMRELVVERGTERRLVWYLYRTRLGEPDGAFGLRRDQILATLTGRPRDGLLLRVSTPLLEMEGEDPARDRLAEAWRREGRRILDWYEGRGI
jgi:EpsI family protein